MLFEQEPWDPLVLSNKIPLQPAFSNVEGLRLPPPTMVFTLINVQGTLTGSPVTFLWDRTNADAFSLVLKPSHWQSTTLHGQPHRRCMSNLNTDVADIAGTRKTSSPMSAPLMPYGRPFCQHLHHHRRRDKPIAGMRKTSSPTSGSSMPYGRPFHQHLHCQAGNGSLPPSAPKTPSTYAQTTSHTRNGSLPPSAPKTPPTNAKMHLRCQLHQLQFLTSSIRYNHHGSGGSFVASRYYALDCVAHYQARTLYLTRSVST